MEKRVAFAFAVSFLLLISSVSAITVTEEDKGSVIIRELGNPAVFNFKVTAGIADTYEIYSFNGVTFSPRGGFDLPKGTSETEVKVYPSAEVLNVPGFYNFEYQLKGQQTGIYSGRLRVKMVSLSQTLDIVAEPLEISDSEAKITVTNTQNTQLEDVKISLKSPFFEDEQTISLDPYETITLNATVDQSKRLGLKAGQYIITADLSLQSAKAQIEGTMEYLEEENLTSTSETDGFLVRDTTITKTNAGNVQATSTITAKRDALSRLFTTFSRNPVSSERNGFMITYNWESTLKPGESDSVTVTTNYTLPFIVLILIVLVAVFVKRTTKANINVRKHVSYVRTKGGEFALKVTLTVNSDGNVEQVQLVDTIPAVMKLYQQAGRMPDRVDAQSRRLFWDIDRLSAGESRVFSYIIYSNISVVGRFELPSAVAIFDSNGKTHEVYSNRAFFSTESVKGE